MFFVSVPNSKHIDLNTAYLEPGLVFTYCLPVKVSNRFRSYSGQVRNCTWVLRSETVICFLGDVHSLCLVVVLLTVTSSVSVGGELSLKSGRYWVQHSTQAPTQSLVFLKTAF